MSRNFFKSVTVSTLNISFSIQKLNKKRADFCYKRISAINYTKNIIIIRFEKFPRIPTVKIINKTMRLSQFE